MLNRRQHQRGDTLIEVLFAVTVFSLLVVGAMALMSRGTSAAERSLETTLARQAIDGQAETLRFMHDAYIAAYEPTKTDYGVNTPAQEWYNLINQPQIMSTAKPSDFSVSGSACPTVDTTRRFVLNPTAMKYTTNPAAFVDAESIVRVDGGTLGNTRAYGIWIEAVKSTATVDRIGYTDFHIRTCWSNAGSTLPAITGTIVRLYDIR